MISNKIPCLVIGDGTKGMQSQSIALAKSIGLDYKLIEIRPFWLSRIFPVLFAGRFSIPLSSNDKILHSYQSKILLTCGSRMAGISIGLKRYLKKKNTNLFTIHIQNPKLSMKNFDILVVPEHDNIKGDNIILSRGSLHEINEETLKKFHKKISSITLKNIKNHIVVLVGGNTKNQKVSEYISNNFVNEIKRIQTIFQSKIIICPSRRTPNFLINKLIEARIQNCDVTQITNELENPYPGIMFNSKFILVTTDSINMLSESTDTGKPVFIFDLFKPRNKKYSYISSLIDNKKLTYSHNIKNSNINLEISKTFENECDRIGKLIKKKLKVLKIYN